VSNKQLGSKTLLDMDLASVLENIRLIKLNVLDVLRPSNEVHFVLLATRTKTSDPIPRSSFSAKAQLIQVRCFEN
jgi:hypothetical protein